MNEIIEKLKDKNYVRAFMLMSDDEQDCLIKVKWQNRLVLTIKGWRDDYDRIPGRERTHFTYAIKPNYQPEPEYVDYLIEICEDTDCEEGCFLGIKEKLDKSPILPHEHTYLYCLPSLSNFDQFWWDSDTGTRFGSVCIENVARLRAEGKKVYARFRK